MSAAAHPSATNVATTGEFSTGWGTLALALAGVATSVSALLIYSLGTLIVPLESGMGWSRADLQIAVSFLAAGGAISVNGVGWLNSRYGMRAVTAVSMLAVALAFASLALMQGSIGWLYLAYFVLPFIGLGTTPVTWTHIVALHFHKHRGLALSLVLCGTGVSAALLPSALTWTMARWGWQAGYLTLAALPLLMWLSMCWRHLPTRGAESSRAPTAAAAHAATRGMPFAEALRDRRFWVCNIGLGLVVSAVYGMATNTVPLLRDIGLSAQQAGAVFGSFGVALIVGRIGVGTLIDRLWAPGVAAVALMLPALGCLLFLGADANTPVPLLLLATAVALLLPALGCLLFLGADANTPVPLLLLATALVGVGAGAEFDIAAYLVSGYFGLRDYGRLFGLHLGLVTAGSTLAPFVFAALLRSTGSYASLLMVCAGCCVLGPLLLLTLGRYTADAPPLQSTEVPTP